MRSAQQLPPLLPCSCYLALHSPALHTCSTQCTHAFLPSALTKMHLLVLAPSDIGNHQFRDHFGTKAYSHRKVGRLVSEALLTSKVG